MSKETKRLDWKTLVDGVREGHYEPLNSQGKHEFLYCKDRNVFISDPHLIRSIQEARGHTDPFMLLGKMGTGKNIFLELVAQGNSKNTFPVECIDENVDGSFDAMMEKFFGKDGVVQQHPNALIHFDLLERASDSPWGPFVDKIHSLARRRVLERTDGKIVEMPNVRVVGGATETDFDLLLSKRRNSSLYYLYQYLSTKQLAETYLLSERVERMEKILSELLASQVLAENSSIGEADIEPIETISKEDLRALKDHSWPNEFNDLVRLVKDAINLGDWTQAISNFIPYTVFIIWSRLHENKVKVLNSRLKGAGIPTFFSPESMEAGDWRAQLYHEIRKTHFVICCISKEIFNINYEGENLNEIRRAIERADRMGRAFILPTSLDGTRPEDLDKKGITQSAFLDYLKEQQWYWFDADTGEGFEKLHKALRSKFSELRDG